jgi:autoinducer 2-degrading protein
MHVTMVHVRVRPEHTAEFLEATRRNHEGSTREAGNLRFDVLQDPNDRTHFVLYEVYRSEADARAHKDTAHYQAWRDAVGTWMAAPREAVSWIGVFPAA